MSDRLQPGDRVALVHVGAVVHDRAGFVTVQWDDGRREIVWRADLERERPALGGPQA